MKTTTLTGLVLLNCVCFALPQAQAVAQQLTSTPDLLTAKTLDQYNPASNVVYVSDIRPHGFNGNATLTNLAFLSEKKSTIKGYSYNKCIEWGISTSVDLSNYYSESFKSYFREFLYSTSNKFSRFEAAVGWDDRTAGPQEARCIVFGDRVILSDTGWFAPSNKLVKISVSLQGVSRVELTTLYKNPSNQNSMSVVWGDARFIRKDQGSTTTKTIPVEESVSSAEVGTKILRLDPEKLKELAEKLRIGLAKDASLRGEKPSVAIAQFKLIPMDQLAPSNSENAREDISTALINTEAFDLVERGQLDKILLEQKMNLKDTFDSATAQKIGKLVGARFILIGSISDRGTYTIINARLIDTQTGKASIAASIELRQ